MHVSDQAIAQVPIEDSQSEVDRDVAVILDNSVVPTMLEAVCVATGLRFAAVARVTDRRWVTCSTVDHLNFGLKPGDELVVESTICHEVRQCVNEVVIDDVSSDVLYRDHHTPKMYGFRSYLSIPILRPDGSFFGTLCALDPEPKPLKGGRALEMARLFAKMIGDTLNVEGTLSDAQQKLAEERRLSGLQEQFMAILAHDLRNPLAAIRSGLRMFSRTLDDPVQAELVTLMDSSAHRMAGLVDNMMDQARNRLGDGIVLARRDNHDLHSTLELIVSEFRAIAPDREIIASIELTRAVNCDSARIAQLLSNLLGNAIKHGASEAPIHVSAAVTSGTFALKVINEGKAIPKDRIPDLFRAFNRGADRPPSDGLGLGLYIASEIAKAHGGRMTVTSDSTQTVFAFEMPCR